MNCSCEFCYNENDAWCMCEICHRRFCNDCNSLYPSLRYEFCKLCADKFWPRISELDAIDERYNILEEKADEIHDARVEELDELLHEDREKLFVEWRNSA